MIPPGTVMRTGNPDEFNPLRGIPEIIWENGGLTLSQLRDLTGLDTPAIHNWINRGYTPKPAGKGYSKNLSARILIINALRETLRLEEIACLLGYVNGDLADESDDLILDSELYGLFCELGALIYEDNYMSGEAMRQSVGRLCADHDGGAGERIGRALYIMGVCYQSALIKRSVVGMIDELQRECPGR